MRNYQTQPTAGTYTYTERNLRRMTAMQLAKLGDEMGICECKCWKVSGGPILKARLIDHILERQAEVWQNKKAWK